jgi:hypothetical protein
LTKRIGSIALLAAAGVLAAAPAVAQATHNSHHDPGAKSKGGEGSRGCDRTLSRAFVVKGTVVSFDGTDVEISVTGANRHARNSGDLQDQDLSTSGTQVSGDTHKSSAGTDSFTLVLSGYETGETPQVGDQVRMIGKIAITKKRCADEGLTIEARSTDVNLRRVHIIEPEDPVV